MYSDISWDDGTGYTVNPGTGIISTPGAPRNIQDVPDLTGNMEYIHGYGHVQVAGIARKLTYQPAVEESKLTTLEQVLISQEHYIPGHCCQGVCLKTPANEHLCRRAVS
jgi:hypothetical protein